MHLLFYEKQEVFKSIDVVLDFIDVFFLLQTLTNWAGFSYTIHVVIIFALLILNPRFVANTLFIKFRPYLILL